MLFYDSTGSAVIKQNNILIFFSVLLKEHDAKLIIYKNEKIFITVIKLFLGLLADSCLFMLI